MIHIYNTLSRKKELLQPIEPDKIGMYVCGITVYDYCHIGHARIFVTFDMVVRYLRAIGYEVFYVRNITDIDDKIINKAKILNISIENLTENFIIAMHEDEDMLGITPPDLEPRASDNISEMIAIIDVLMQKGYAYKTDEGDVYYDIDKFENYGALSNQSLDKLNAGIRVKIDQTKHSPLDFALWKSAKPNEPSWPSPWGNGRPGWHIECSVMSILHVGEHFDIHGGGADLVFPHHENEIAQSEGATGHKVVNTWMHVGFVEVNKEKMSKSTGNFFTIREVLKHYHPEVIRYFILSSHYRSPLNYTTDNLDSARAALSRFYTTLQGFSSDIDNIEAVANFSNNHLKNTFIEQFHAAMQDDFNTPEAFAVLFNVTHEINRLSNSNEIQGLDDLVKTLIYLGNLLGILRCEPLEFLRFVPDGTNKISKEEIELLVKSREESRKNKDWKKADEIRAQLSELGVELEDKDGETTWKMG